MINNYPKFIFSRFSRPSPSSPTPSSACPTKQDPPIHNSLISSSLSVSIGRAHTNLLTSTTNHEHQVCVLSNPLKIPSTNRTFSRQSTYPYGQRNRIGYRTRLQSQFRSFHFFGKQNITICKSLCNTSCALTLGLSHKGACRGEGRDPARAAAVDFRWEADVRELMFFLLLVSAFPSFYQTPTLANNPPFFCFRHLLLRIILVRKGVVNDVLTRR